MDYLYILQQALVGIITIFWLYNIAISVCSLIKFKEKPLLINKKHKFSLEIFGKIYYNELRKMLPDKSSIRRRHTIQLIYYESKQ